MHHIRSVGMRICTHALQKDFEPTITPQYLTFGVISVVLQAKAKLHVIWVLFACCCFMEVFAHYVHYECVCPRISFDSQSSGL